MPSAGRMLLWHLLLLTEEAKMGHRSTAVERLDAISGSLEWFFERDNVREAIWNARGYRPGPAEVITKALVAGLLPPKYKAQVVYIFNMKSGWKNKHDDVLLDVMQEAAIDWKTVEQANHLRSKNRAEAGDKGHQEGIL